MIVTLDMTYENDQYINIILSHVDEKEIKHIFYAEFSDFDIKQIKEKKTLDIVNNLKFEPPPPMEEEYWTWGKTPINVELRGTKNDIKRYVEDWLRDLAGVSVSWIDYTDYGHSGGYRNIKPLPEHSTFEIWMEKNFLFWEQFCELWSDKKLPNYIITNPKYLST